MNTPYTWMLMTSREVNKARKAREALVIVEATLDDSEQWSLTVEYVDECSRDAKLSVRGDFITYVRNPFTYSEKDYNREWFVVRRADWERYNARLALATQVAYWCQTATDEQIAALTALLNQNGAS